MWTITVALLLVTEAVDRWTAAADGAKPPSAPREREAGGKGGRGNSVLPSGSISGRPPPMELKPGGKPGVLCDLRDLTGENATAPAAAASTETGGSRSDGGGGSDPLRGSEPVLLNGVPPALLKAGLMFQAGSSPSVKGGASVPEAEGSLGDTEGIRSGTPHSKRGIEKRGTPEAADAGVCLRDWAGSMSVSAIESVADKGSSEMTARWWCGGAVDEGSPISCRRDSREKELASDRRVNELMASDRRPKADGRCAEGWEGAKMWRARHGACYGRRRVWVRCKAV